MWLHLACVGTHVRLSSLRYCAVKIYVASSWKNQHQFGVVAALRDAGHEVYDFKHPVPDNTGFAWREVGFDQSDFTAADYVGALMHPRAVEGYSYDMAAMEACDACVLVLPAGRSASFELGWCLGRGKGGIIILPPDGERFEPELMYKGADYIVSSVQAAIDMLERV